MSPFSLLTSLEMSASVTFSNPRIQSGISWKNSTQQMPIVVTDASVIEKQQKALAEEAAVDISAKSWC